ncbi:outer membrane channel protein TolC [Photobacterium sp. WH77]|uniref:Outer membrane channel protein TolC n=1 Tax=Photobacterium arenosum TaxID=2774143 RepID=A0ABR9BJH3_9GAMM|nr:MULTISPECIES: outer membrane channel protein TolC [Photobacterium]MBD8512685.1 outer membrane channel protein TolC [Photobacterium arenosum]MBV7261230.1 outer membrane channel protein TolC [Photobacterium sp. WH24]MCG2835342.1 outer membrane channel protein TolC [Photobacterium sp. WH77]MCG2842955.1 outer membrane channel protein TolC [Photobacterium sp. WH80]MDO6580278.1 outer membrane channel protein TolC [Photobacterium sp. 2_MG-2023]
MKKLLPLYLGLALGSLSPFAMADDLADIYEQAKQNDPQLLRAAADKDTAFEAINSSRSTLLPQINLTAGLQASRLDIDDEGFNGGLSLSQSLYNRASWVNLDISEKQARQSDASYAVAQQNLILRVSTAYFSVLRAMDDLEFVRAEKAAVGRQLEQTKQRFEVGLSAITDVHDAQAQYDSVLADEILKENALTNSYEELREITGQAHKDLSVLDTQRFSASSPNNTVRTLLENAESENLTLLSARIAQDVSRDRIALAESGHLPTLSFDAGYSYNDMQQGLSSDEGTISAGINLNLPVYTGGRVTSEVKQAQYAYVSSSETLEETYRGVVKNVRAFYNNINASIGALKAYQQSVISARSALEATEAGFDVGTRTIVDVLDATRRLYDANRQLATARYDYIISQLQLKQAVGSLNEQDILDVNTGLIPVKK